MLKLASGDQETHSNSVQRGIKKLLPCSKSSKHFSFAKVNKCFSQYNFTSIEKNANLK